MCESQCGLCFIFICKRSKLCNYIDQFLTYKLQGFCHNDNIGIITYITGGSSQMDDSFRFRTLHSICIYMRHYIMTHLTFTFLGNLIINVICVSLQLIDLLLCNVKTKFLLCLSKSNPKFSPCAEFHIRRKNILHFFTCITL